MAQLSDWPWHQQARKNPAAIALWLPQQQCLSWRQLAHQVDRLAGGFASQGVRPGSGVILSGENSLTLLLVWLALLQLGARLIPVNPRFTAPYCQQLVRQLDAGFIFTLNPPSGIVIPHLALRQGESIRQPWQPDQPATLTLTSGSGGEPKAVAHTLAAHLFSAAGVSRLVSFSHAERWLLSLPLYHVSGQGILWRWLWAGAGLVLPDPRDPRRIPVATSIASLVPTQLWRLLRQPESFSVPDNVLLGGAVIPDELVQRAEAVGIRCWCGYGMTEAASTLCGKRADSLPGVGVPLEGREIRLDRGQILVRGQMLGSGYWQAEGMIPFTDRDGWFATGDVGEWRAGELVINGRQDNRFFSAGENIQPEAIERVLLAHPAITQVFVVPVPDPEYGQRPVALVTREDATTFEQIKAWSRERLTGLERPVHWFDLPANAPDGGIKFSRRALQQQVLTFLDAI